MVAERLRDRGYEVLVVWLWEGLTEVVGSGDTLFFHCQLDFLFLSTSKGEAFQSWEFG